MKLCELSESNRSGNNLLMFFDDVSCSKHGENAVTLSIKQIMLFEDMAFKICSEDTTKDIISPIKLGDSWARRHGLFVNVSMN